MVGLRQGGVVRTNCLDSLDRTNKVQSKLAWWTLASQVRRALSPLPAFQVSPSFLINSLYLVTHSHTTSARGQ